MEDTDLKMEPSAEERLGTEPSSIQGDGTRRLFLDSSVVRLQERVFRDGAKAERERILTMLRMPSDELWHQLMYEFGQQANRNDGIERILDILADTLDKADPT